MKLTIKEEREILEELGDLDYEDENFDNDIAEQFYNDILTVLNDIINTSDIVKENFISSKCTNDHYRKHCLYNVENRRSTTNRVYYDFTNKNQYIEYEKQISYLSSHTDYEITTLYDYDLIIRYIRKLFEGGITLNFTNSCGLRNNDGRINMTLHSFATNVTENYQKGNTIDICIKSTRDKTITLYPVDAHKLENKFNSIIRCYGNYIGNNIKFNND